MRTREGCTVSRYEQLETSTETIEQELRPAFYERQLTDRLKENYSIDCVIMMCEIKILLLFLFPSFLRYL